MRRLLVVTPLIIALAGLGYLLLATSQTDPQPGGKLRERSKKEWNEFHYVPELGEKARRVNGSPFLYEVRFGGRSYTTHFHGKDTRLLRIDDRLPRKPSKRSSIGKVLSGYAVDGPGGEIIRTPPNEVSNWDWTGRSGRGYYRNNDVEVSGATYHCTQTGPRLEFVYIHPPTWNRYRDVRAGVKQMVQAQSSLLSQRSWELGGPPVGKMRVECTDGDPTVYNVTMQSADANDRCNPEMTTTGTTTTTTPTTPPVDTKVPPEECYWTRAELNKDISDLRDYLRDLGYKGKGSRYVMLWDGTLNGDNRASAYTPDDDDQIDAAKSTTYGTAPLGPYYGNEPWGAYLHESMHMMGALSEDAPNYNNQGHCTDGHDLMCYTEEEDWNIIDHAIGWLRGEGQPIPQEQKCDPQDEPVLIDCHGEDPEGDKDEGDYFNPLPKPGSFLDKHWNIAGRGWGYDDPDKRVPGFVRWSGTARCKWINVGTNKDGKRKGGELACTDTEFTGDEVNLMLDEERAESVPGGGSAGTPKVENVPAG